jgi:dTDP-4-dehydrorhamnose 3,5-epimerase
MKVLEGIKIIKPKIYNDNRGLFYELWNKKKYANFGIKNNFVQDNFSFSKNKGTFRGFHYQKPPFSQAKLVWCSNGSIIDYVVDIRKNSNTFGELFSYKITSKNKTQIFIPIGFLHGFLTLEDNTEVNYKVSKLYNPEFEETILYNDRKIGLKVPKSITKITISKKDMNGIQFKDLIPKFKYTPK